MRWQMFWLIRTTIKKLLTLVTQIHRFYIHKHTITIIHTYNIYNIESRERDDSTLFVHKITVQYLLNCKSIGSRPDIKRKRMNITDNKVRRMRKTG